MMAENPPIVANSIAQIFSLVYNLSLSFVSLVTCTNNPAKESKNPNPAPIPKYAV